MSLSLSQRLAAVRGTATPSPRVSDGFTGDAAVAAAWGISPYSWMMLSDSNKADYRDRIVYAPNFGA